MNIGLDKQVREDVVNSLRAVLTEEYQLYQKTLSYHWNIQSFNFIELHELLEKHYLWLKDAIDDVAERIRALGFTAHGTNVNSGEAYGDPLQSGDAKSMLESLVTSHEKVICHLRDTLDSLDGKRDYVTEDLLTQFLSEHEKMTWMLRSHLA